MDHKIIDKRSLELNKLIIRKMKKNPDRGIRIALGNIARCQKIPDFPINLFNRWRSILLRKNIDEIKNVLLSESDEGQQMRQATPFCGILTQRERMKIFRKYSHR
jgi:hypothetical protein